MEKEYQNCLIRNEELLKELQGELLKGLLINIAIPEFNVVYLKTKTQNFSIYGQAGSEYIGIHKIEKWPEEESNETSVICKYPPFEIFLNHKIVAARQIGAIWNGHGFELSFEGIYDKTLIVQSIYTGEVPAGLGDCLRLGIGYYQNEWEK